MLGAAFKTLRSEGNQNNEIGLPLTLLRLGAEHRAAVLDALALIPRDAPVSGQSGLLPRLTQREPAWEFPLNWSDADWVIVDRYGQISLPSIRDGSDAELARVRAAYALVFARDGVEVFHRPGAAP